MQHVIMLIAYIAVSAAVSSASVMTIGNNERQRILPMSLLPKPLSAAGQTGHQTILQSPGKNGHYVLSAAQQTKTLSHVRVTVAGHTMDQTEWFKFVPSPSRMPTATPHYATDMHARLSSNVAANVAQRLGPSSASSVLVSDIASLEMATSSAAASMSALSRASLTESANRAAASKELEDARNAYKKLHNTGSLITPSLSILTSFAAAFVFAGLAFVL